MSCNDSITALRRESYDNKICDISLPHRNAWIYMLCSTWTIIISKRHTISMRPRFKLAFFIVLEKAELGNRRLQQSAYCRCRYKSMCGRIGADRASRVEGGWCEEVVIDMNWHAKYTIFVPSPVENFDHIFRSFISNARHAEWLSGGHPTAHMHNRDNEQRVRHGWKGPEMKKNRDIRKAFYLCQRACGTVSSFIFLMQSIEQRTHERKNSEGLTYHRTAVQLMKEVNKNWTILLIENACTLWCCNRVLSCKIIFGFFFDRIRDQNLRHDQTLHSVGIHYSREPIFSSPIILIIRNGEIGSFKKLSNDIPFPHSNTNPCMNIIFYITIVQLAFPFLCLYNMLTLYEEICDTSFANLFQRMLFVAFLLRLNETWNRGVTLKP